MSKSGTSWVAGCSRSTISIVYGTGTPSPPGWSRNEAPGQQRELQARAESGGHPVPARQTRPGQHRLVKPPLGLVGQILGGGRLRPADDDQVIAGQVALEQARVLRLLDVEAEVATSTRLPTSATS